MVIFHTEHFVPDVIKLGEQNVVIDKLVRGGEEDHSDHMEDVSSGKARTKTVRKHARMNLETIIFKQSGSEDSGVKIIVDDDQHYSLIAINWELFLVHYKKVSGSTCKLDGLKDRFRPSKNQFLIKEEDISVPGYDVVFKVVGKPSSSSNKKRKHFHDSDDTHTSQDYHSLPLSPNNTTTTTTTTTTNTNNSPSFSQQHPPSSSPSQQPPIPPPSLPSTTSTSTANYNYGSYNYHPMLIPSSTPLPLPLTLPVPSAPPMYDITHHHHHHSDTLVPTINDPLNSSQNSDMVASSSTSYSNPTSPSIPPLSSSQSSNVEDNIFKTERFKFLTEQVGISAASFLIEHDIIQDGNAVPITLFLNKLKERDDTIKYPDLENFKTIMNPTDQKTISLVDLHRFILKFGNFKYWVERVRKIVPYLRIDYHGNITKEQAEEILKEKIKIHIEDSKVTGFYLVRDGRCIEEESGYYYTYVLCFIQKPEVDKVTHVKFWTDTSGQIYYKANGSPMTVTDYPSCILKLNVLPISNKTYEGLHVSSSIKEETPPDIRPGYEEDATKLMSGLTITVNNNTNSDDNNNDDDNDDNSNNDPYLQAQYMIDDNFHLNENVDQFLT
eukprot:TRINITY_DN911_c0_g1_i1.p1 TRINITY_DN911_c0_g1~~TRINITY_DN911_c0_g1_i1.p1  ORF type:complete len:609 (+),score=173.56 TRINITY_DN911_c0_g1_i1:389-2215(+)